jgi:PAS domain S-box-containing protein
MIVISATRDNYGRVIHANDEVECLLGYKRKDLIGKNVSIVIPKIIGEIHDLFIKKYLETAENRAIDLLR